MWLNRTKSCALACSLALLAVDGFGWAQSRSDNPAAGAQQEPIPVRNDTARPRQEVLVLRNHRLAKGGHERF